MTSAQDIIHFWFNEETKKLWFNSSDGFDEKIRTLFELTYNDGVKGLLKEWKETPQGALALVILFDQFPLNMYRGDKKSFEAEALSRNIAQLAIDKKFDETMTNSEKSFLYMPFMHSENSQDQLDSIRLFEAAGLSNNVRFAKHHQKIIQCFGRFPHRNAILGRENTPEEIKYLNSDNAFLG